MDLNLSSTLEKTVLASVPTFDGDVKLRLRHLGEPITYFGEDKADRRNRLIKIVTRLESDKLIAENEAHERGAEMQAQEEQEMGRDDADEEEEEEDEEFWTPGPDGLVDIRLKLAKNSLENSKQRVNRQYEESKLEFTEVLKYRRSVNKELAKYELIGSNHASTRATSVVRFSPSGTKVATGSWSGELKIINSETLEPESSINAPIKSHQDQLHNKISGLDWHPHAESSNSSLNLVSANSNNNSILLWSLDDKVPLGSMQGHEARIVNTKFHPTGDYIASSSYDKTWRFWDVEKQQELFLQEGHSKEVQALSFQKDGALIASGGLDAIGKIWDLRTGKEIMSLCSHIKEIMAIDWSDNGYQLATGSKDCTIKIWDLRYTSNKAIRAGYKDYLYNDEPLFTIPAHTNMISDLNFFHNPKAKRHLLSKFLDPEETKLDPSSTFLVSSSYDGTIKIWSADNWFNVKTLRGHTDRKIMSCDVSASGDRIVSSGWDRSVKLWSNQGLF